MLFRALAFVALTCALPTRTTAQERPQPNLLVILVDDMGYADLSCYGSKQIDTPNIDALAAAGTRCTNGYVSSTVCAPSRAGLLTGRFQNRFGFEHNLVSPKTGYNAETLSIPKNEKTIADRVRALGYRTAIVGKWHVGESLDWQLPNARGFDYFFGMRNGHHTYFPKPGKHGLYRNDSKVETIDEPYLTDWLTSEAMRFIDGNTATGGGDAPWLLYLAYNTPHTPLEAKQEHLDRVAFLKDKKRRTYAAMQLCLDDNIGRLREHLEERGLADDTLVVFLSDNGGPCDANASINAPLRGQKGTFLEGGIRVPTIWSWPGRIPAGQVYDKPVLSLDILPTMLAAAGGKLVPEKAGTGRNKRRIYDGVDLLPFFNQPDGPQPHERFCMRITLRGAVAFDGQWKLLRLYFRPPQLFDLSRDISEQHDLAARHPDRVREMLALLTSWEESYEKPPMWLGTNYWMTQNRRRYDLDFALEQPDR